MARRLRPERSRRRQSASGASSGSRATRPRATAQIRRQRPQYARSSSRVRFVGRAEGREAHRAQGTGTHADVAGGAALAPTRSAGPHSSYPSRRRCLAHHRHLAQRPRSAGGVGRVPPLARAGGRSPHSKQSPRAARSRASCSRCVRLRQAPQRSCPASGTRARHAQSARSCPALDGGVASGLPRRRRMRPRLRQPGHRPTSFGCVDRAPQ